MQLYLTASQEISVQFDVNSFETYPVKQEPSACFFPMYVSIMPSYNYLVNIFMRTHNLNKERKIAYLHASEERNYIDI